MSDYVKIPISNSDMFTLVSQSTAEEIGKRKIHFINREKRLNYVSIHHNGKEVSLHRFVMKAQKGQIVDHINGDKLDNRLENLRFVTCRQNLYNHNKKPRNITGFWGISRERGKYYRLMITPNIQYYHGTIRQPLIGALIRDDYVRKVTNEKNAFNFPEIILESELKDFLLSTNGSFLTVYFVKKTDGKLRKMNCRFNVTKYMNGKGLIFKPDDFNLIVAFDMKEKTYKMINLNGVLCLAYKGKKYRVKRERHDKKLDTD